MSGLFQKLEYEAFRAGITPRSEESRQWFMNKVRNLRVPNRLELMKEPQLRLANRQLIGSMNMFFYDAKHKDTLPYFDKFPLTIIVGPAPGGFSGLNLHYLPLALRAKFLDGLLDITNNKRYDESTRFALTYSMLQRTSKTRFYKACYKHYLMSHVKSRFARVEAPEWEIATFLPMADFQGASAATVWKDSRKKIGRYV
ncbi:hypothetical protein OAA37_00615 [bacterium]|jgi:hypothetical protein|nr:hypothetical protein [bacterium]MDB4347956.1 hypothetical protein [bacterium]MDB4350069.1 hypothetical protein [bacterium]